MKPKSEKRLAVVIGGWRDQGARRWIGRHDAQGLSRGLCVLSSNCCRASALASVAGHDGSRCAGERRQGGGLERGAYSLALNAAHETEERLRGASRPVVGAGGAGAVGQVKLCCCATCCQACAAANPQRDHVNNYVKRLVLKHEPRSLAPLRAFG